MQGYIRLLNLSVSTITVITVTTEYYDQRLLRQDVEDKGMLVLFQAFHKKYFLLWNKVKSKVF